MFSALFGNAKKDDNVSDLLLQSAGPVSRPVRGRTVISVPDEASSPKVTDAQNADAAANASEGESSSEADDKEVTDEVSGDKKSKKRVRSSDDDESEEAEDVQVDDAKAKKPRKEKKSADTTEEAPATKSNKKGSAAKTVDLKAEELEKASRTVFVGNVSNKVITSKSTYKDFKKLFSAIGAVESIRFRSIAFDEALPRKVAFVKKALHDTRDTLNAYVVFTEKEPSKKAPGILNATTFDDFHIRVDHVAHPSPKDNKRTIFVGNLDFSEQEETLWKYFNDKISNDVEAVRIVRDAKTNLGKGFALVQFKDTLSVNKALFLNDKPIDAADGKKGRKLRILRAKSHAKPSVISPNHFLNQKKTRMPPRNLNDDQETKLGRAKRMLGKADRNTAGRMIVEGARATKGLKIEGIKGLKSAQGPKKKARITKRSSQFKLDQAQFQNLK